MNPKQWPLVFWCFNWGAILIWCCCQVALAASGAWWVALAPSTRHQTRLEASSEWKAHWSCHSCFWCFWCLVSGGCSDLVTPESGHLDEQSPLAIIQCSDDFTGPHPSQMTLVNHVLASGVSGGSGAWWLAAGVIWWLLTSSGLWWPPSLTPPWLLGLHLRQHWLYADGRVLYLILRENSKTIFSSNFLDWGS